MDTLEAIRTRRSVRQFTQQPIPEAALQAILRAGTAGPTAVNARDWTFIVVRDRKMLGKMADCNGPSANPLRGAALGVLVCGDLERAYPNAPEFWIVDGSVAAQNMLLAAHSLGLGGVWLGTWPHMDRVERLRTLFALPDTVAPHSMLAFGYPAEPTAPCDPAVDPSRFHFEKW